jgi:hypothetical protein
MAGLRHSDTVSRMPLGFHEYREVLRHARPFVTASTESPDFVAIVSAQDAAGARAEAEKLVTTLMNLVSIVSIEPRPPEFHSADTL